MNGPLTPSLTPQIIADGDLDVDDIPPYFLDELAGIEDTPPPPPPRAVVSASTSTSSAKGKAKTMGSSFSTGLPVYKKALTSALRRSSSSPSSLSSSPPGSPSSAAPPSLQPSQPPQLPPSSSPSDRLKKLVRFLDRVEIVPAPRSFHPAEAGAASPELQSPSKKQKLSPNSSRHSFPSSSSAPSSAPPSSSAPAPSNAIAYDSGPDSDSDSDSDSDWDSDDDGDVDDDLDSDDDLVDAIDDYVDDHQMDDVDASIAAGLGRAGSPNKNRDPAPESSTDSSRRGHATYAGYLTPPRIEVAHSPATTPPPPPPSWRIPPATLLGRQPHVRSPPRVRSPVSADEEIDLRANEHCPSPAESEAEDHANKEDEEIRRLRPGVSYVVRRSVSPPPPPPLHPVIARKMWRHGETRFEDQWGRRLIPVQVGDRHCFRFDVWPVEEGDAELEVAGSSVRGAWVRSGERYNR